MAGKSKTYELALKIGGKADGSLKTACMTADKNLTELGKSAKNAGKVAAAAMAAIGTGIAAAGTAMYKVGAEFDGAYDAIRIGTGATGDALGELQDSFMAVYSSVPAEMADVGTAIADYNTRLGVTGGTLEDLSKAALQVSDMLGDDLGGVIEKSSQAFQQWNVGEEKMAGAMDYIFKVSQSTGAGFADLMTDMQTYGAQLQELGYGFDQGAVLIGQLGKAGVNTTEVLGAMKKSVTAMANKGLSATEGMEQYYKAIKNAGDATEATRIASEVFGTRAASTMAAAIRDGSMAVDDLTASLAASGETINGAATDTYDFAEKWDLFKQRMAVAVEPAAMAIFNQIGDIMDRVAPQIEAMAPMIAQVATNVVDCIVKKIIPAAINAAKWVKEHKTLILALAAGVTAMVVTFKTLKTALTVINTVKGLSPVFKTASEGGGMLKKVMGLLNLKFLAITTVIAAAIAAGIWLCKNWDSVKAWAVSLGQTIAQVWGNIKTWVSDAIANLVAAFQNNFPLLSAFITGWWQSISAAVENVKAIFTNIIDFVKNVFSGDWSAAWDSIVAVFGNIFGAIVNIAKAPINGIISAINFVIGKINCISFTFPDWVPGLGGETWGFSIPEIPQLAVGGIATGPTLAQIGEGGEPEAVLPLSKLAALLDGWTKKPKPDGGGAGAGGQQIVFSPVFNLNGPASKADVEEAARISLEEFKRLWRQLQAENRRKNFTPA